MPLSIQEEQKEPNYGNIILQKPILLSDKDKRTPLGPIEEEKEAAADDSSSSSDEFVRIERDYETH